jgi:catalytic LigB subunit of aromatic ring-opening dioxygenase
MSSVIGGAMLPHAPQFFTMPETEDRATIERVRAVAAEIGGKLKAMAPDLWIIFSNDHAEQFFHKVAPPFTVHVGDEASGSFAGRMFRWKIQSRIGFELVRQMYRQGFDPAFTSVAKIDYAIGIPLTHLGVSDPVLPIYINAYLPPQPTIERCYARPGAALSFDQAGAGRTNHSSARARPRRRNAEPILGRRGSLCRPLPADPGTAHRTPRARHALDRCDGRPSARLVPRQHASRAAASQLNGQHPQLLA